MKMMGQMQGENATGETDMQPIGKFLSFASRGDKVGLNQMLMDGTSPDVQDYDNKIALHLAASEGHAPIVELLLHCKANVNLVDRWQRTFLGSIVHGEEMILITEYLPKGNLDDILTEKGRLDLPIALCYALDIARDGLAFICTYKHIKDILPSSYLDLRSFAE